MKIGIMTLWGAFDNYGQQFQVYALQHFLRKNGHDAFIIRYEYKKDVRKKKWFEYFYTIKYIFDFGFICNQVKQRVYKAPVNSIDRRFDEFANINIKFSENVYKNIFELQKKPPEADVYITGSDQVWNFSDQYKPYENKIQAFYLNFGKDNIKRIAYAASFGKEKYGKALKKYVTPFLKKFDMITCREKQGVKICNSMQIESKLTLDPVFLNDKNEYLKLIDNVNPLENERFCLVYLLGNPTVVDYKKIEQYARENVCKIIFVPGKGFHQNIYEEIYPTPTEWLWYMNNAEFIITNSFHGTAISVILKKQFSVLPLAGKNSVKQNDRIYTMLELLNISSEHIGLEKNPLSIKTNWTSVENNIKTLNRDIGLLAYINREEKV